MAASTLNGGHKAAELSRAAEIVISGMSGKFPNSATAKEYIDNILNKVDLCDDRQRPGTQDNPKLPKLLGKIPNIESSDIGYFGLHLKHAIYMNPMSRIIHEQVIAALFDAGIHPDELKGTKTGVFVGVTSSEYDMLLFNTAGTENTCLVGSGAKAMIANNLSYHLQLNGPSFCEDSACSSSMYAMKEAYEAILYGRCERAIVGGCNICLGQNLTLQFADLGVLNQNTGCRPFDEDAQGYTRSEAIVVVILQKRVEAKRIYANIVHLNTNSDGFKANGITYPSSEAQFSLMQDTYHQANISPKDVGYLEAHGTGTKVGDPEELDAVDKFFQPSIAEPLLLGSVKGNIGHTEPVAALCSLVKVLYALYFEKIPPNIHFSKPREGIAALRDKRLQVVTEVTPFPSESIYAAINSFGFGGANGQVILKASNHSNRIAIAQQQQHLNLVCYSARTQSAIEDLHCKISTCVDVEYLRLIQEYFKYNCDRHLYRGFTVAGTGMRSYLQVDTFRPCKTVLMVDTLTDIKHFDDLLKIPLLSANFNESKRVSGNNKKSDHALMAAILLKTFKELECKVELLGRDDILAKYFNDEISFKNLVKWCTNQMMDHNNNLNTNANQSIKKWIKMNSFYGSKCIIILIGNNNLCLDSHLSKKCTLIHFHNEMTQVDFICNLGRLYQAGCNMQIHKLNEDINFPVGKGTEMLSHLMDWKQKYISIPSFGKIANRREKSIFIQNQIYEGHIIDNRNLFPATGYLYLVWDLLADLLNSHCNNLDIVFENLKFRRACTYSDKGITFNIGLQVDGDFEVSQNELTLVTGTIKKYDETIEGVEQYIPEKLSDNPCTQNMYVMNNKDVYRELRLRRYNYRGLFRAIHEVGPQDSKIKWDNEWITFLDNMMQVAIVQEDSRALFVPVGVDRIIVRASKHIEYADKFDDGLIPVRYCKYTKTICSKFVKLIGMQAKSIPLKKDILKPVLESYQFIPNEYATDLATSVRINIQILLECKPTFTFRVVEVLGRNQNAVIENICTAIADLPQVLPDFTVVTSIPNFTIENAQVAQDITAQNQLFICQCPDEGVIHKADKALLPDGFLLCLCNSEYEFTEKYTLLTTHVLEDQRIVYFLRKSTITNYNYKPVIYDVSDTDELKWVKITQDSLKRNEEVVLFAQNNFKNGILGLANCLTKEPDTSNIRCVFLQDTANVLDPNNNDFIMQQLEKRMAINVYKNGTWGTYRHLLLPNLGEISSFHWYANTVNPGDLSTLKWLRGAIIDKNNASTKISYSALNFRDLMLASGKISIESITKNRLSHDYCQGFEYSGYSLNGQKLCGFGSGAIANWLQHSYFQMDLPDGMHLEEAATIPVVYCTVLYALLHTANLRRGQSILIHSGTGGIGLAALNVCTSFECDIFVTVGTQEKRDYILNNFPNIKPNHIGNSRNTSFKDMILRETNGHGVDLILNSLADEKLQASIVCLAAGGYFLEIGKYDLERNSNLCLDLAMIGANFCSVMLDRAMETAPKIMEKLRILLQTGIKTGYVKPLPTTVFEMDELERAFRYLGTGKHIGKVLIRIDHEKDQKVSSRFYCDPTRSYIILGGLGGFGLELADWLVLRGAKHIILSSRKGVTTGYQRYRIRIWKSYGVNITILTEDVTNYDTCYNAIKSINAACPLDGIFNLAVVLKDAIWENQTIETMKASMEPKAILTEHLDKITREVCPKLRYFVVFSSVSCGRGNAGQSNYGFSNSIMERICELRHADGLPSLAIQWGAVGDVGILEEIQKEKNEIVIGGTLQQKVLNCLTVLDQLILQGRPIVSSMIVADKFAGDAGLTPIEAICKILGITYSLQTPMHMTLPEIGMDSMMAVEIKQILERDHAIMLNPNDLKNLTFSKLDDLQTENKISPVAGDASSTDFFSMLIPRLQLVNLGKGIIDFNIKSSKVKGDFVIVFPGIDAGLDIFEAISKVISKHFKCAYYDVIAEDQTNVDVIVDYMFLALREEIEHKHSFHIVAYSIGCLAAIELTKRLEAINVKGKLIIIDGSPDMIYQIFVSLKDGKSDEEFQCNMIEKIMGVTLPNENIGNVREITKNANNLVERMDLMMNIFGNSTPEIMSQVKSLIYSFDTRLNSVAEYKKREQGNIIESVVVLYKASNSAYFDNIAEDYNLSMICETVEDIYTFEGSHTLILFNEKLHQQLLLDIE